MVAVEVNSNGKSLSPDRYLWLVYEGSINASNLPLLELPCDPRDSMSSSTYHCKEKENFKEFSKGLYKSLLVDVSHNDQ